MPESDRFIIGAMSGTSIDGVDVALVRVSGRGPEMRAALIATHHRPYDPLLRRAIVDLRTTGAGTLPDVAWINREVSLFHAAAVNELLISGSMSAANVAAIAAHGQTVFHDPPNTLQWLDPALIASETGCCVVSDFRRADCAAGGQGAPLVPFADYCLFRHREKNRVLLNIGGIANVTFLPAGAALDQLIAFDTGPGNCISDHLVRLYDPSGCGYDDGGQRAHSGMPIYPLVNAILANPYFSQPPPKSTDGPAMIKLFTDSLAELGRRYPPEYLLRTACLVTADTILQAIRQFLSPFPDEIIVSGGGVRNQTLMSLLKQPLGECAVMTTDDLGVPAGAKEAIAFALLGAATLDNLPSNVPSATGARRPVVLGSITPKP
ncbi:MAG: anhydro-N-acetylmuramic acid kinase [Tepidisphaeraceae bacterium]|jgi:anhydro-N-acetylmuramic acid kinase